MPSNTNPDMLLSLAADCPAAFAAETFQGVTGFTVAPFSDTCTADAIDMPAADYPPAKSAFETYTERETATLRHNFLSSKLPPELTFHTAGRQAL